MPSLFLSLFLSVAFVLMRMLLLLLLFILVDVSRLLDFFAVFFPFVSFLSVFDCVRAHFCDRQCYNFCCGVPSFVLSTMHEAACSCTVWFMMNDKVAYHAKSTDTHTHTWHTHTRHKYTHLCIWWLRESILSARCALRSSMLQNQRNDDLRMQNSFRLRYGIHILALLCVCVCVRAYICHSLV